MGRANSCGWTLYALQPRVQNSHDRDAQGFRSAGKLAAPIRATHVRPKITAALASISSEILKCKDRNFLRHIIICFWTKDKVQLRDRWVAAVPANPTVFGFQRTRRSVSYCRSTDQRLNVVPCALGSSSRTLIIRNKLTGRHEHYARSGKRITHLVRTQFKQFGAYAVETRSEEIAVLNYAYLRNADP